MIIIESNNSNNSNNEYLFFKIFRNKYLNSIIFSNLYNGFKYEKYNYYQIVSCEWMISNGYYELLKYKVGSCEYLIFDGNSISIKLNNNKKSIYTILKSKNEKKFYHQLFKNYFNYFKKELTDKQYKKQLVNHLIEIDNLGALIEISDNYNFKIKEKHLLLSFELNSLNIAEYIYTTYKFKISPTRYWSLLCKETNGTNNSSSSSSSSSSLPICIDHMDCKNLNNRIIFLINVIQAKRPDSKNAIPNLQGYCINETIWEFTLQELIDTCTTLSYLEKPLKSFVKHLYKYNERTIKYTHSNFSKEILTQYLNEPISMLSIQEINQIKNDHYPSSSSLLSTNLEHLESSDQLHKLFKMVLPFTSINLIYFKNYVFYSIRFTSRLNQFSSFNTTQEIILFFTHSKSRELKTKYLQSIKESMNNIKQTDESYSKYLSMIPTLFMSFIQQDDLEYIQFTAQLLMVLSTNLHHLSFSTLLDNVSSSIVFQFIYTGMKDAFLDYVFLLKRNPILLLYFKQLYPLEFQNKLINQKDNILSFISTLRKSTSTISTTHDKVISNFIYENLQVFLDSKLLSEIISISIDVNQITSNEFYFLFQISRLKNQQTSDNNTTLKLKKVEFNLNQISILFNYYKGNLNFTDKEFFIKNSSLLFGVIGKNGDIDSLDKILSNTLLGSGEDDIKNCLNYTYHYASVFGQISIFKFIKDKYPNYYFKNEEDTIYTFSKQYSKLNNYLDLYNIL